jgi:hypothetical protein
MLLASTTDIFFAATPTATTAVALIVIQNAFPLALGAILLSRYPIIQRNQLLLQAVSLVKIVVIVIIFFFFRVIITGDAESKIVAAIGEAVIFGSLMEPFPTALEISFV